MRAQGKVVVVTGASMGIGEAIAKKFVTEGANVVFSSRDQVRCEVARERVGSTERTIAIACDVSKHDQLQRLIEATIKRFGRIDVFVNNAGFGLVDSVAKMDMKVVRELFETNLFAIIDSIQLLAPIMKQQGSGDIINISSVAGHIAVPNMASYGASKHALNCIGKAARLELKKANINVLTVCPGYIATDFGAHAVRGTDFQRVSAQQIRVGPDVVANDTFRGWLRRKREVITPWYYTIPIWIYRMFPGIVENRMLAMLRRADQAAKQQAAAQK